MRNKEGCPALPNVQNYSTIPGTPRAKTDRMRVVRFKGPPIHALRACVLCVSRGHLFMPCVCVCVRVFSVSL